MSAKKNRRFRWVLAAATLCSLSEYAARYWHGLIAGYYGPRWQAWFDATRQGKDFDQPAWEEAWITTPGNVISRTSDDPLALAKDLIDRTRGWTDSDGRIHLRTVISE